MNPYPLHWHQLAYCPSNMRPTRTHEGACPRLTPCYRWYWQRIYLLGFKKANLVPLREFLSPSFLCGSPSGLYFVDIGRHHQRRHQQQYLSATSRYFYFACLLLLDSWGLSLAPPPKIYGHGKRKAI